jgi:hypothetical protein
MRSSRSSRSGQAPRQQQDQHHADDHYDHQEPVVAAAAHDDRESTRAGPPLVLGPFTTGPVKLSDLYGIGAGATLTILGVPF